VDVVEELGADAYIYGQAKAHLVDADLDESEAQAKPFIARVDGRRPPEKGQTGYLRARRGPPPMFNADSGERMGDCPVRFGGAAPTWGRPSAVSGRGWEHDGVPLELT